jgi:hypothetical protein
MKLKALRTDRGGEFNSTEFTEYCEKQGIKHFRTAPYTPQQNGVVERRNQTVVAMARSLLKSMGMPAKFWGEAVSTAVYLLNRAPTKSVKGQTPYEAWHGRKPSVQHLRTFGCTAHVKKLGPGQSKLADRSKQTVFIGYETGSKAYRLYDPVQRKLIVSRDVVFEEDRPWDWSSSGSAEVSNQEPLIVHYSDEAGQSTDRGTTEMSAAAAKSEETPAAAAPQQGIKTRQASTGTPIPFALDRSPTPATPVTAVDPPATPDTESSCGPRGLREL